MGGAEGVIDIDVAEFGQFFDKRRVLLRLFLAWVETDVFQQEQLARAKRGA